jgi:prefoldin subunit 5
MSSKIQEAINTLEDVIDDIPGLSKTDLEYALTELENEARSLSQRLDAIGHSDESSQAEALADSLNSLYNEV